MTAVRFYHMTRTGLEQALPQMLEKTLERGQRAVVKASSETRVEAISARLWTYNDRSFLPHGSIKDGRARRQPVWLTVEDEAPNGAEVLFLTDGASSQKIADFQLCVLLFDGGDDEALAQARAQWKTLKDAGHEVTYWQQDDDGRWGQKA
jgi:DNA polymerase III subunit chi